LVHDLDHLGDLLVGEQSLGAPRCNVGEWRLVEALSRDDAIGGEVVNDGFDESTPSSQSTLML
jgi:hypothetical protein